MQRVCTLSCHDTSNSTSCGVPYASLVFSGPFALVDHRALDAGNTLDVTTQQ